MRNFKLWMAFALTVIIAMTSSFFFSGFFAYQMFRPHLNMQSEPAAWVPLMTFAIAAVFVSIFLTLFLSRSYFSPIKELIDALKKVTAGDFNTTLPETVKHNEIYQMNANFNRMVRELNSMELIQFDFIQNVSHEFKTPLSAIEGYASLLNDSSLPEELHEYTQRILESTKQLSSLTGNILRLSKLENQQIISEKSLYSLDEQLRQAVLSEELLWGRKNLDINIDLPEIKYFGNEDLLFQVWTNLLSNAIKFTPDGGSIYINGGQTANHIVVAIRDTGIGMTNETKARIFEKFYQGEQNRNMEGNGLGLALTKKIVDLCEGTIKVTSQLHQGTSFEVRLPKNG